MFLSWISAERLPTMNYPIIKTSPVDGILSAPFTAFYLKHSLLAASCFMLFMIF